MIFDPSDYKNLTDEVLFNRYAGGDFAAFEELVIRNKNLIYSLILRYVNSSALADEIFQEVFLKVCKNKDLFRESISFKAWIATICKNTCIDYVRKQNRELKVQSIEESFDSERSKNLAETVDSQEPTPDDCLRVQDEHKQMMDLLDKLPVEQKETFYLKVVMELTFEEIGESMSCSTNTAKSRYRYALDTLRATLNRKKLLKNIG